MIKMRKRRGYGARIQHLWTLSNEDSAQNGKKMASPKCGEEPKNKSKVDDALFCEQQKSQPYDARRDNSDVEAFPHPPHCRFAGKGMHFSLGVFSGGGRALFRASDLGGEPTRPRRI
jgi:hypothetical protein